MELSSNQYTNYTVDVIFNTGIDSHYSYISNTMLDVGTRVIATLRNREQIGFVKQCRIYSDEKNLLNILSVTKDSIPIELWNLYLFTAQYYRYSFNSTVFYQIPAKLRDVNLSTIKYSNKNKGFELNKSFDINLLSKSYKKKYEQLLSSDIPIEKTISKTQFDKFLEIGVIVAIKPVLQDSKMLNDEQKYIVENIKNNLYKYHPALLHGITGSGKTEVFLAIIYYVLINNSQILLLIPEINLSPQLFARIQYRYPYLNIKIVNSQNTPAERIKIWLESSNGDANVVIATRIGVFLPFKKLGLIIVDEEHDLSFKQSERLHYNSRDLAVWRAKQLNIPIILASATPSIASNYNAEIGKYHIYKLTNRAVLGAKLPTVKLLDIQNEIKKSCISKSVIAAIEETLSRNEQVLIFINRRGYAPIVRCNDCGWIERCKNCSASMVYHKEVAQLRCHYCSYKINAITNCLKCNGEISLIGHGTQYIEDFIKSTFKSAKVKRADKDTVFNVKMIQELAEEIEKHNIDIIIGTQMLAKGHDFPNLTLVVGVDIDRGLFSSDFRSDEYMLNILTQISGRAGRGNKSGVVLLQTLYPEHKIYQSIKNHDYISCMQSILSERKHYNLPPYSHQALIKISSNLETKLHEYMEELSDAIQLLNRDNVLAYPPIESAQYKIRSIFHAHSLISSNSRICLNEYIDILPINTKKVKISIDIDPIEF